MPIRRRLDVRPLSLAWTDYLLLGHTRNPDDVPDDERATYDAFLMFDVTDEQASALWRLHRVWLLDQARQRGITAPWAARFDV